MFRKTLHSQSAARIPFTPSFNHSIEEIILDFLHPDALKEMSESKQTSLENQTYIQIPAQDKVNPSYKALLENLHATAAVFLPKEKLDIHTENTAKTYQDKYSEICKQLQPKLTTVIETYDPTTSKLLPHLIGDCIMHYCYNNKSEAGKLLDKLVRFPNKSVLVNFLLGQGAIVSNDTMLFAVIFGFPLDTIRRISEQTSKDNIAQTSDANGFPINIISYATLHPDTNVLNFVLAEYPQHLTKGLEGLNKIKQHYPLGFTASTLTKKQEFHYQTYISAPNKLLKAAKNSMLNEETVLTALMTHIAEAKTPEEWQEIYKDHINVCIPA